MASAKRLPVIQARPKGVRVGPHFSGARHDRQELPLPLPLLKTVARKPERRR